MHLILIDDTLDVNIQARNIVNQILSKRRRNVICFITFKDN